LSVSDIEQRKGDDSLSSCAGKKLRSSSDSWTIHRWNPRKMMMALRYPLLERRSISTRMRE